MNIKLAINSILKKIGYRFIDLKKDSTFIPYIQDYNFKDVSFKMWLANKDDRIWYDFTHWETSGELLALQDLVSSGDEILEVGSHHGFTAMLLANYAGALGKVYSIEAHPKNCLIANAQLGINPEIKNLKFENIAAASDEGIITISNEHNSSVTNNDDDGIKVQTTTCDIIDEEHGPFNFIKIDVEGYEIEVLKGCKNILSKKPKIAIEIHCDILRRSGKDIHDVLKLIDIEKYNILMVDRGGDRNLISPFSVEKSQKTSIVNLFFSPK